MENNKLNYQRDEHRVHLIVYHLVWTTKRRKAVLVNEIAQECRELIEAKCTQNGWEIIEFAIQPDHIHLYVRVWTTNSAAEVIKECKGVTSHVLREKYPQLRKLPSLWTRSYFAATSGNVSSNVIEAYITAQKGL